ncbi:PREDICTED: obscurin-like, partial [Propithecus coquereli]|uniref:obscurin-like n=1 Tax=Propithecus coquereli TaxID=379532 RepID=UPI00063EEED6
RRLVVPQAGRADAGEYSCEAGGQRVSFRLDVTEPKLMFAKEQPERSEVRAEAGASTTLSCEVAQAQTEVTWYKDGKQLSASPQPPCLSPEPKLVFAKEQPERSEVRAEAGASATLSCEVAQAQTEVTWYKDGKQLSASPQVRVEAKGKQRRLVVPQAGRADAGEYSCEAGGQRVSFRLDVTVGPRKRPGSCHPDSLGLPAALLLPWCAGFRREVGCLVLALGPAVVPVQEAGPFL